MSSAVDYGLQLYFIVTKIVTSLLSGAVVDGRTVTPAEDLLSLELRGCLCRPGALGFMPRILVLTTLPHRRPESHQIRASQWPPFASIERGSTRRLCRTVPIPRLLLAYLTTQAVRTKSPEIHLGATPNDLARKLGLSVPSAGRGAQRVGSTSSSAGS